MDLQVSLDDELTRFVENQVSSGRHGSSGEVVREALRLMEGSERREAEKLRLLRDAWQEGIDSGDAGELDVATLKREARARLAASRA